MADPVTIGAAVGWSMKAAGWVISPIISNLVKQGSSYLGFDTSEKLRQLEIKVLQLELMLEKETDQMYAHRIRLDPLLQSLKSAFYEAEDILDDVEYHLLKRQIEYYPFNKRNWACKIHSALPSCSCMKNQEPNHSNVDRRKTVNVTTAAPPHVVTGRDEDRDNIIALLHENVDDVEPKSNRSLSDSIIGIHGIPGSGKSTLAKDVCAYEEKNKHDKKDGHFDLIMWVRVSQNFSVDDTFKKMLEEATGNPCPKFYSPNTLEEKLAKALSGTRFLLEEIALEFGKIGQEIYLKMFVILALDFGNSDFEFSSKENMSNLGRLTSLQTAPNIKLKKKAGYEIQQLKHLNKLRGRLYIEGLENIESKEAALEANLSARVHLKELKLEWGNDDSFCAEVLEGLCPPTELQTLDIRYYKDSIYPSWMIGQHNGPEHLNVLRLWGCSRLESIPEESKLFTHLCKLKIRFCSWDSLPDNMERLSSLEELELIGCQKITSLNMLPQSLKKIRVGFCNAEQFTNGHKFLQELELFHCFQLESISEVNKLLTDNLLSLKIESFSWDSLPDNMERLRSLEELELGLSKITTLPTLPQSLKKFVVSCGNDEFISSCQTVDHPNWQKIKHIPYRKM
uniref:Uncharacterized protein n=1 Tax=Leersia perrieri TaxID=77586 RepID=A0A0D9XVB7_9ORYZ